MVLLAPPWAVPSRSGASPCPKLPTATCPLVCSSQTLSTMASSSAVVSVMAAPGAARVLTATSRRLPRMLPAVPAPYAPGSVVPHGSPAEPAPLSAAPVLPAVRWPLSTSSQTASATTAALGAEAPASAAPALPAVACPESRSEEHTSELQSLRHLVCRLLLEQKKKNKRIT